MFFIFILMVAFVLILGGIFGIALFGIRDGLVRTSRLAKVPPVDEIEAKKREADRKQTISRAVASLIAFLIGLALLVWLLWGAQIHWGQQESSSGKEIIPGELH